MDGEMNEGRHSTKAKMVSVNMFGRSFVSVRDEWMGRYSRGT